LNISDLCCWS